MADPLKIIEKNINYYFGIKLHRQRLIYKKMLIPNLGIFYIIQIRNLVLVVPYAIRDV